MICYDQANNPRPSNQFSVQISCGPKSVQVVTPITFRQLVTFIIDGVNVPEFKYDNFTTVPPGSCNIQSHRLIMDSNKSTNVLKIQEG